MPPPRKSLVDGTFSIKGSLGVKNSAMSPSETAAVTANFADSWQRNMESRLHPCLLDL